ncbi:MAG: SirB2 family protein, partial [Sinobacterium sp.]|nr:SirB2 family protein [Sinobacterium sp.]
MDSSVTYMAFKHLHMTLALLSFIGFVVRSFWAAKGSSLLSNKWVKVVPHIIDTLLLLSAISLVIIIQ